MKIFIFFSLSLLISEQLSAGDAEWLSRRMEELNQQQKIEDPNLRIKKLKVWFGVLAPAPKDQYEQALYKAAQEALLKIPGHAFYVKNRLEIIRSKIKSGEAMDPQIYHSAQAGIGSLRHLPSAESIAVLGYFLNDPEGRDGRFVNGETKTQADGNQVNCTLAAFSLNHIGIANPPVDVSRRPTTADQWDYEDAWKEWWNEVAAGKRTYRFIGSDVEYGPDGPVSKDKLERIKRDQKRDEERSKSSSGQVAPSKSVAEAAEKPSASFPATGLAIAILLGGGAWVYYRRKKWK